MAACEGAAWGVYGCASWGEDDTWRVLPRERIDGEFRNPLYDYRVRTLWQITIFLKFAIDLVNGF